MLRKKKVSADTPVKLLVATSSSVTRIVSRADTTEKYDNRIEDIAGPSSCVIRVSETKLGDGYRALSIAPASQTVSYKRDGAVTYRKITHLMSGKAVKLALACDNKGNVELYSFMPTTKAVDCAFLAKVKLSSHIVDPMFALITENCLYLIYNVPSDEALSMTPKMRRPQIDGEKATASGYPGIVRFNLKTSEQTDLLPSLAPLPYYACGLYFDDKVRQPKLALANIYKRAVENEPPSIMSLIESFWEEDSYPKASLPVGVSSISFIDEPEISQAPLDGDPANGICSVILENSDDERTYLFRMEKCLGKPSPEEIAKDRD